VSSLHLLHPCQKAIGLIVWVYVIVAVVLAKCLRIPGPLHMLLGVGFFLCCLLQRFVGIVTADENEHTAEHQ
jgi:hypothetical protein